MTAHLLGLPTEILGHIIETVYRDGCQLARAILPLSLTCKALRHVTEPLLFAKLTIETEGCYGLEASLPRWLYNGRGGSPIQLEPNVAKLVTRLDLVCWRRYAHELYSIRSWAFPEALLDNFNLMRKLRTITCSPPHAYTATILHNLEQEELHVVLDFRHYESTHGALTFDVRSHPKWTWSIANSVGFWGACETTRRASQRLRALQWSHPIGHRLLIRHVSLLDEHQSYPLLEELHVSERVLDLDTSPTQHASNAPQICRLIPTLPSLRRIRVEGADLTKEFLSILPRLVMLEDISVYSVYRRVFHPGCDGSPEERGATTPMPWLQLPRLRKLDLRFVCNHFVMEQIIPKGLLALRIEFYGVDERLTLDDMDWLATNCPDLERLEVDIGALEEPESYEAMLTQLGRFRRLRVLRLFPTYWRHGKLVPQPFQCSTEEESVLCSLRLFIRLRTLCPNLNTLILSISFGEYPFDIISRMWVRNRPLKFVLRNVGAQDDVMLHWGYAAHDELYARFYRGETQAFKGENIPTSEHEFFDDLNEGWILEHHELHRRTM